MNLKDRLDRLGSPVAPRPSDPAETLATLRARMAEILGAGVSP